MPCPRPHVTTSLLRVDQHRLGRVRTNISTRPRVDHVVHHDFSDKRTQRVYRVVSGRRY